MNKRVKFLLFSIFSLGILFMNIKGVMAASCDTRTAEQLAKIVYHEVGADTAKNADDNFFQRLTTASVVLNNANNKSGSSMYEKLINLTDNNYYGYSSYKNNSFSSEVPQNKQGEMLYIAELVLSEKYNVPKNMTLQASKSIVSNYGTIWTYVENPGYDDVYFGYEGSKLSDTNVFNTKLSNTTVDYYKKLAKSYEKSTYNVTSSTVCSGNIKPSPTPTPSDGNSSKGNTTIVDACTNPDILRVIYFGKLIVDIVKIVIPIGLIIMGMIDFSKSVVSSDEGAQKKNITLLGKRIIFAILVFAVPWIVETLMVSLGNLTEGVNFTDCLENANSDCIEQLENGYPRCYSKEKFSCYYCPTTNQYLWKTGSPSESCPGGIGWSKQANVSEEKCNN